MRSWSCRQTCNDILQKQVPSYGPMFSDLKHYPKAAVQIDSHDPVPSFMSRRWAGYGTKQAQYATGVSFHYFTSFKKQLKLFDQNRQICRFAHDLAILTLTSTTCFRTIIWMCQEGIGTSTPDVPSSPSSSKYPQMCSCRLLGSFPFSHQCQKYECLFRIVRLLGL